MNISFVNTNNPVINVTVFSQSTFLDLNYNVVSFSNSASLSDVNSISFDAIADYVIYETQIFNSPTRLIILN